MLFLLLSAMEYELKEIVRESEESELIQSLNHYDVINRYERQMSRFVVCFCRLAMCFFFSWYRGI